MKYLNAFAAFVAIAFVAFSAFAVEIATARGPVEIVAADERGVGPKHRLDMVQFQHPRDRAGPHMVAVAGIGIDHAARPARQRRGEEQIVFADAQRLVVAQAGLAQETPLEHRFHVSVGKSVLEQQAGADQFLQRKIGVRREPLRREHGLPGFGVTLHDFQIVHGNGGAEHFRLADHARQPVRMDGIVGVEHRHEAAGRNREPGVAGAARSAVPAQFDHLHEIARIPRGHRHRAVARAVVDDDDFHRNAALRQRAFDRAADRFLGVEGGDGDRLTAGPRRDG